MTCRARPRSSATSPGDEMKIRIRLIQEWFTEQVDSPTSADDRRAVDHHRQAADGDPDRTVRGKGPVPFLVGVTGHRDPRPEDAAVLERAVKDLLKAVVATLPTTDVWVLTGMAGGADQLAARVATGLGLRVVPLLPMPNADFERDLDPQQRANLRGLLSGRRAIELPWLSPAEVGDDERRRLQYQALGAELTNHSQLLVALWSGSEGWDGRSPCSRGGTADVVRRHLRGTAPDLLGGAHALDLAPLGVVAHVVTPRLGRPSPAQAPGSISWLALDAEDENRLAPEREVRERLWQWTQRTDRLNREIVNLRRHGNGQLAARLSALGQAISAEAGAQEVMSARFTEIDAVAARLRSRAIGTLPNPATGAFAYLRNALKIFGSIGVAQAVLYLGLAGLVCQQARSLLSPNSAVLLLAGHGLIAAALALHVVSWWRDLPGRYLDYRALAEGLRVALFWRIAGSQQAVADHYLRRQRGPADWVRLVLRAIELDDRLHGAASKGATRSPESTRAALRRFWIDDQLVYFGQAAWRDECGLRMFRIVATTVFAASLLSIGAHYVYPYRPLELLGGTLQLAAVVILALAGVLSLSDHANAYRRMREIFARAASWLEMGGCPKDVAQALGYEALEENAHWLVLHRQRPVDIAHSGLFIRIARLVRPFFAPRFRV